MTKIKGITRDFKIKSSFLQDEQIKVLGKLLYITNLQMKITATTIFIYIFFQK